MYGFFDGECKGAGGRFGGVKCGMVGFEIVSEQEGQTRLEGFGIVTVSLLVYL